MGPSLRDTAILSIYTGCTISTIAGAVHLASHESACQSIKCGAAVCWMSVRGPSPHFQEPSTYASSSTRQDRPVRFRTVPRHHDFRRLGRHVGQDRHPPAGGSGKPGGPCPRQWHQFIDTADVYAGGVSEQIVGQALKNLRIPREDVVVASKVFGEMGHGPNARGLSRSHIIDGVKASLKRLQLDHIDLYQVHGFDPATPIEETLRALDTMVQHGHVRYIGVSNWAAWQIAKALGISERLGLASFQSLQAYYSVAGRDLERELIPM